VTVICRAASANSGSVSSIKPVLPKFQKKARNPIKSSHKIASHQLSVQCRSLLFKPCVTIGFIIHPKLHAITTNPSVTGSLKEAFPDLNLAVNAATANTFDDWDAANQFPD
jgi:hypothetical protein